MTPVAFSAGLSLLGEVYPRELSDAARALYLETCGHLADDVWAAAIRRCIAMCRFYPVPAEILAAAEFVAQIRAGIESPDDAWLSVQIVARRWYPGQSVRDQLAPLTITALAEIGGISSVAGADHIETERLSRRFRASYDRAVRPHIEAAARGAIEASTLETPALDAPASILSGLERP